jgi:hypothetical protein
MAKSDRERLLVPVSVPCFDWKGGDDEEVKNGFGF